MTDPGKANGVSGAADPEIEFVNPNGGSTVPNPAPDGVKLSAGWTFSDPKMQESKPAKWKAAAYFNRIKERVRSHWAPQRPFHDLDPDGKKFGTQDRYTLLHVSLTADGLVHDIAVDRSSEVELLDQLAAEAFRSAVPFMNAPRELVDKDNLVTFKFGFFLKLSN